MAKTKTDAQESAPSGEALPASETRAPEVWAREYFPASDRGRQHKACFKHGAAAALHGWALHEHHAGAAMQLTREAYLGAIRAASAADNNYAPHPAALSPFHGRS
jgi:hypothetical protein